MYKYILLLFCGFAAAGCMQSFTNIRPTYELFPDNGDTGVLHTTDLLTYSDGGFTSRVRYEGKIGNSYSFEIAITNEDTVEYSFYPADIAMYLVDSLQTDTNQVVLEAFDPEEEIANDKELLKKADKEYKNATNLNACTGITSVALDLLSSNNADKAANVDGSLSNWANTQDADNARHKTTSAELKADIEFWEKDALRSAILRPGETVSGIVLIPVLDGERKFELEIPLGDISHVYRFQQIRWRVPY